MLVPNYNAFKAGLCTDMEYFKFSYAGKDGQVIKKTKKSLGSTHPFYVIKRPLDPVNGHKRYEFKIYDMYHSGYIHKEVIVENPIEKIKIPSINTWWEDVTGKGTYFREYILFCRQTHQF